MGLRPLPSRYGPQEGFGPRKQLFYYWFLMGHGVGITTLRSAFLEEYVFPCFVFVDKKDANPYI